MNADVRRKAAECLNRGMSEEETARFLMITRCAAELPRFRTYETLVAEVRALRTELRIANACPP